MNTNLIEIENVNEKDANAQEAQGETRMKIYFPCLFLHSFKFQELQTCSVSR